ncbi:hypothetical protein ACQ9LF_06320 [Anaerohalosphaeraceae bacterium U12dextr]|jgi:hypothetical protein
MPARLSLTFVVPSGILPGDRARLYANSGSGPIKWDTPYTNEWINLYPANSGIYGFGLAPWGRFAWGRALALGAQGFGLLPWGRFAWGLGGVVISRDIEVADCGDWLAAFQLFDALGNISSLTPGQVTAAIHIAPAAPDGLKKESYNPVSGELILSVRSRSDMRRWILPSRLDQVWNSSIPGRLGAVIQSSLIGSGASLPLRSSL